MRAPHSPGDKHRMSLMDTVLLSSQPASHREKKAGGVELLADLQAPSAWNNATTKISFAKRGSLF